MRKYFICFCSIALICAYMSGCGTAPVGTSPDARQQSSSDNANNQSQTVVDNTNNASTNSYVSDRPNSFIYTTDEHIIPMSESVTVDGITHVVLDCKVTSEFGHRKLENLNYFFEDGGIDDRGNLLKDKCYVFLNIQFTNTNDYEVEINRGNHGIYFMDEHLIIEDYTVDAIYIDEYWLDGTASEVYHYKLEPGESIFSEIGWIVSSKAVESHDKIYYTANLDDCLTDSGGVMDLDAVFIDLEY